VARKVLERITCDECRTALVEVPQIAQPSYILLQLRDQGGLYVPSRGLVVIIQAAEKNLRTMTELNKASRKATSVQLQSKVLLEIGSKDLFDLDSHFRETQCGLDNHYLDIIRMVVHTFFTLRQFHILKLQNLAKTSVRHKLNKSVLFMGQ
jgi:hypothetical protein